MMQESLSLYCPDVLATEELGLCLSGLLEAPLIIHFRGEIGAGKTTLIRALLRGLGVTGSIKSPTFALIEPYQLGELSLHHLDLYRIEDPIELENLGIRDYLSQQSILCIEWPERAGAVCPPADLLIEYQWSEPGRVMNCFAVTARGAKLIHQLKQKINEENHGIEIR